MTETLFVDLYRSHPELSPGEQQALVERQFPSLVPRTPLHLWSPGDPIAERGRRVLVGVATYSGQDMELLDRIGEALNRSKTAARVDVFNTLDCRTHEDFAKYVPGFGDVYQTPVVGVWLDGTLQEAGSGYQGRLILARALGLELSPRA